MICLFLQTINPLSSLYLKGGIHGINAQISKCKATLIKCILLMHFNLTINNKFKRGNSPLYIIAIASGLRPRASGLCDLVAKFQNTNLEFVKKLQQKPLANIFTNTIWVTIFTCNFLTSLF
jgi:myosin-crossreactive antigen